jgi:hypothetical protein
MTSTPKRRRGPDHAAAFGAGRHQRAGLLVGRHAGWLRCGSSPHPCRYRCLPVVSLPVIHTVSIDRTPFAGGSGQHVHDLVGRRRRAVDAGAEIGHEQEFLQAFLAVFQRHHKARDAHQLADDGRFTGALSHTSRIFFIISAGARVAVVQHLEIDALEVLERVPVGRHQGVPGDGARMRPGLGPQRTLRRRRPAAASSGHACTGLGAAPCRTQAARPARRGTIGVMGNFRFAGKARRPATDGRRASRAPGWQAYPPAPRRRTAPTARRGRRRQQRDAETLLHPGPGAPHGHRRCGSAQQCTGQRHQRAFGGQQHQHMARAGTHGAQHGQFAPAFVQPGQHHGHQLKPG